MSAYLCLEIVQDRGLDVELPLEIAAHLTLHLVDLSEINSQCPEEPFAAGKQALNHWRR